MRLRSPSRSHLTQHPIIDAEEPGKPLPIIVAQRGWVPVAHEPREEVIRSPDHTRQRSEAGLLARRQLHQRTARVLDRPRRHQ